MSFASNHYFVVSSSFIYINTPEDEQKKTKTPVDIQPLSVRADFSPPKCHEGARRIPPNFGAIGSLFSELCPESRTVPLVHMTSCVPGMIHLHCSHGRDYCSCGRATAAAAAARGDHTLMVNIYGGFVLGASRRPSDPRTSWLWSALGCCVWETLG